MIYPTLTIFSNFRINDEKRFIEMQDSFNSFKDIKAQKWVINVRGIYAKNVIDFIKNELGDNALLFNNESGRGWFYDSRALLKYINSDFVMIWVEDHINLQKVSILDSVVNEMFVSKSDYLNYTWWFFGKSNNMYNKISKNDYNHIQTFNINKDNSKDIKAIDNRTPYLISLQSIFSKNLFTKILMKNDPILKRWPKETPFDFEKKLKDIHWLPFRMSISKNELFACIDDDNGVEGYSLHSRGLYPVKESRHVVQASEKSILKKILFVFLPKSFLNFLKRIKYSIK